MTWRFDSLRKYDRPAGVACFCDTQWGVAVGYNNEIKVCAYWGEETEFEFGIHDSSIYPNIYIAPEHVSAPAVDDKTSSHWKDMVVVNTFSISSGNYIKHLHQWQDRLFVFTSSTATQNTNADDTPFSRMFVLNALTGEVIDNINLGEPFVCKPQVLKNKIWLTTQAVSDDEDDEQYLVSLDVNTYAETSRVVIPARKQSRAHRFVLFSNTLVIDLFNDNSIAKFNATTGQFISSIWVNRKPLNIYYNSENKLVVGSYEGMVSEVDLITGVTTHITSSFNEATGGIISSGNFVWVGTSKGLSRTDTSLEENNFITQEDTNTSSAISRTKFLSTNIREVLLSQPFDYEAWINGSVVQHSRAGYILVRNDSQVLAIRDVPLWRDYYNQVLGTAIISTGETEYYGETE